MQRDLTHNLIQKGVWRKIRRGYEEKYTWGYALKIRGRVWHPPPHLTPYSIWFSICQVEGPPNPRLHPSTMFSWICQIMRPRVKCVKTILSLCQPTPPPTRVTCLIWPPSQLSAAWFTSCDAFHTAWLTPRDLPNAAHAPHPLSRTPSWLTSCDLSHLRDLHNMTCVTCVTYVSWSTSRWWPRTLK